jgi:hypothetical protein
MANVKLSQIAAAGANPSSSTNFVAAISSGDLLYTLAEIQGGLGTRTVLSGNMTYYVATTGSDSNPGTSGSPWLTPQHAMNFLSQFIDLNGFTVTVSIGAGTFGGIIGQNTVGGGDIFFQGNGVGSTIIHDTVLYSSEVVAPTATIYIDALSFTSNGGDVVVIAAGFGNVVYLSNLSGSGNLAFDLSAAAADSGIFTVENYSTITVGSTNIAVTLGTGNTLFTVWGVYGATGSDSGGVWTFSGTATLDPTGGFVSVQGNGLFFSGASYSGGGGLSGLQFDCEFSSSIQNDGSAFPGTGNICDPSSTYNGFFGVITGSGTPTTSQFTQAGTGGLYKDTTGGSVYIVYNDAGTIKKVALT